MSNPRDEVIRFVMGVADLVREKCCTTMLHDGMILDRVMVYAWSIEEFKHRRVARSLKMSCAIDQDQPSFKYRAQPQEESRSTKFNIEKGGDSKNSKPTCVTCGKKHYGECLLGTGSHYCSARKDIR